MKVNLKDHIDPALFRRDLVRWQQLVTPAWLASLLAGEPIAAAPSARLRLIEIGFGHSTLFLQAHIPGATYIDTNQLEQEPQWNKVSDQALLQLLLDNGIRHNTTVVLYGRNTLAAARAAHLMLYAGVADVRMLDGGYAAWESAGLPLARGLAPPCRAASDFGADFPAHPEYLIDMQQARKLSQLPGAVLVSIRTWNEYIGKTSGYSYIQAKGEIPGARWGRAGHGDDVNSMSAFHNADGTMKPSAEICRFWKDGGIEPGLQTAFYCGTGWRASLAFFYAWLMNWERISVYEGGWCEWSRTPDNQVTCTASSRSA